LKVSIIVSVEKILVSMITILPKNVGRL